uniref:Capsid protein n=1 Tax=Phylloscopus tenellipes CRESS-DNA-virus sp. TaxID=2815055 RepID=A0A8A4XBU8_9VIRU|nr:MAG: capsid protein [Phylloscopus tenellipes CRESS-DNA-virus sp.]
MALRRVRRVVRRATRRYTRPFRSARKFSNYRRPYRVRRAFTRRRAVSRRIQNDVRFSCKSYEQSILTWVPPGGGKCINDRCWNQFERNLPAGLFFEKNVQFINNLSEYQWVKFNYIAVKMRELNYYGWTDTTRDGTGAIQQISGITAMNFDNMPLYCMWDLEQDMSFGTGNHIQVDAESLSQYQLTKKLYPKSRRGITFMWRFPAPWRQYLSTYEVRTQNSNVPWHTLMALLTGIKNYRAPSRLLCAHQNPFVDLIIPTDPAYGVKGRTQVAYNFYLGVSFKGRAVQGIVPKAASTEIAIDI